MYAVYTLYSVYAMYSSSTLYVYSVLDVNIVYNVDSAYIPINVCTGHRVSVEYIANVASFIKQLKNRARAPFSTSQVSTNDQVVTFGLS